MTWRAPRVLAALLVLVLLAGCAPDGASRPGRAAAPAGGTPAAGQARKADDPWALVWRRAHGPGGEVVKIGAGMIAIGPVDGQARRYLFAEPERGRELLVFTRTYAPFRLRAGGGVLELRGQGAVKPTPGDRRMIFEWARQVAAEAGGVEPGSGYGLALTWQRVAGSGCDEVAVYLSGEVRTGRCGGNNPISGRLAPGPLAWLYARFDRLAAFQAASQAGPVGLSPRLVFAGRGGETPSSDDRRDLEGFGAALARELAPRPSAPPPPAAPAARGRAARTPPPPASPAGPRLLLPPQRALPLPEVILPDDRLPPPPPVPPREERQEDGPAPAPPR
ncbi:MAG TPA: hypothetical protein VEL74_20180 [Thermoanaerobaculia bacterium]|nr:hypothetical protein [Thermoanaerobaculia bacterium]